MNVVLYARVSSEKQAEKDLSIPAQLKHMRAFAIQHGHDIVAEYIDEAESARTANRPQFQAMVASAKNRQKPFEAILVWKLSRFARSREDSIIYKSVLRKHGVQVISINEAFDDSPASRMLEGMIEVVDEFYSINLGQDTLRGMKENASRGNYSGGTPPIGYRPRENSKGRKVLDIDPETAPIVQQIFRGASEGLGAKEIASRLNESGVRTRGGNLWTRNTILYTLRNEVYTGTYVFNKKNSRPKRRNVSEIIRVAGAVPELVSREIYDSVQRQISDRAPALRHPRTVGSRYLLAGLLRCGFCDKALQGGSAKSGKYHYYACYNKLTKGRKLCQSKFLPQIFVENIVLSRIKDSILSEANLTRLVELVNEQITLSASNRESEKHTLGKELIDRRRRLDRLFEALESGTMDFADLAPRIKDLREQTATLERRMDNVANGENERLISMNIVASSVKNIRTTLQTGTVPQQKQFLRAFIVKIEYRHPTVTIFYTFPTMMGKSSPQGENNEELTLINVNSLEYGGRLDREINVNFKGNNVNPKRRNPVLGIDKKSSPDHAVPRTFLETFKITDKAKASVI